MSIVIDSHMHIGQEVLLSEDIIDFLKKKEIWESMSYKLSPAGVIEALDAGNIDKGVIFPLTFMPKHGRWEELNDMTAAYVQQYPDRLMGLAIINPDEISETLVELERAFNGCQLVGVKFHPTMQKTYINDERLDPVYAYCEGVGNPVLIHTGASLPSYSDKYSMPLLIDDVAVKFPSLKIIMAHGGRPFYQDAAMLLRKHENVYFDVCANLGRTGGSALLEMALKFIKVYADALSKGLFGSDFPIFSPEETLELLREIKNKSNQINSEALLISESELEKLLGLNAQSLFIIESKKESA